MEHSSNPVAVFWRYVAGVFQSLRARCKKQVEGRALARLSLGRLKPAPPTAVLCFVTICFVTVSFAQEQSERPVFRSGISLVRMDVQIVDASGRPIPDIRQDEVKIVDGDGARPILLFQQVSGATRSYVEAAERTITADISTNQGAPQGQLFVLVFDQDHIRTGGEQRVRDAADRFLREQVRRQDRVAIFGLPGPGPTQPFTANIASARQQLSAVRGSLVRQANGPVTEMTVYEAYEILRGNELVMSRYTTIQSGEGGGAGAGTDLTRRFAEDPAVVRRLLRENAQTIVTQADADSSRFLRALADLLRGFRGIDGRKTVVLFSEGFYGDNVSRELEDVAAAAAETYSVVHAFDLNHRADVGSSAKSTADEAGELSNRLEPLGSLSAETGGDLVKDASTRLPAAFATLLPDDGSYYLLGFAPRALDGDGQYRRVRVQVSRPGARVISRTGYAVGSAPGGADRRGAIDAALAAPFTQQGLQLEYTTYVGSSLTRGLQRVAVSLVAELPVRGGPAGASSGRATSADVVFVVRDSRTGRTAASGSDEIALPDATERSSTGRTPWQVAFDLPAGDYIMRCVVREPGGIVGSADRRFSVRALGGHDVAAADLLIFSPGERLPVRARTYTAGLLTGVTRLYAPTDDRLQGVTARLELTPAGEARDPKAVGRVSEGTIGEILVGTGTVMRDVTFAVPLERLPAGPYVARATIRVGGEVVADLRRPIEVIAGSAPEATVPTAGATTAPRPVDVLDGEIARRIVAEAATRTNDRIRAAAAAADRRQWPAVHVALQTAPADDPATLRLRGLAELAEQNYAAAAATLDEAFTAAPDQATLAFVLGWARIGAGNRTGAVTAFRNAALLEPKMVAAHLALAETYVALGQPALARQAIDAGLQSQPQSLELQRMAAALKSKGP